MLRKTISAMIGCLVIVGLCHSMALAHAGLQDGKVSLTSIGPMAFGPDGILFVSDPRDASVYAIQTMDSTDGQTPDSVKIADIDTKIAALLGTAKDQIQIEDMVVNPLSKFIYLAVNRGRGADATPVIVRIDKAGALSLFSLEQVHFAKTDIPKAPAADAMDRRNQPLRLQLVTDMAYADGKLFVAGLSNEEFPSKLHVIPFPFGDAKADSSVEIYHTSHGRFETNSPVRTFTHYRIGDEACLLAAYTCTPLVKIPVKRLTYDSKVVGETIAELGNRNRPLDMFVYNKDGEDYILMANSSRGMMKITTKDIGAIDGMTEQVNGKAGLTYETLEGLDEVYQLDRYDQTKAVILIQSASGDHHLESLPLP